MAKTDKTYADIPNFSEDWNNSSTENIPYSGDSVQKFVKNKLKERATKINVVKGTKDPTKLAVVLYGENDTGEQVELDRSDEFKTGEESTDNKIVVNRVTTENPVIKKGDVVKFTFFYDHVDPSGVSTGIGATAVITVRHGSTANSYSINLTPNKNYIIDPSQYLVEGSNTVQVKVTTDDPDNPMTGTVQWTCIVTELILTSEFDITHGGSPVVRGDILTVDYGIQGSGTIVTKLYLDGVETESKTGITQAGLFTVNTSTLNRGVHTIQLVSELDNSGTILRSNSIEFVITVTDETYLPGLAARFDYADGRIISDISATLVVEQYSEFVLPYTVYNPVLTGTVVVAEEATAQIYADGKTLSTSTLAAQYDEFSYKFTDCGSHAASLYAINPNDISVNTAFNFNIEVSKSDINIVEPEGNVELVLSAMGKTNTALDKDSWSYGNINTTFEGVSFENGSDGWSTDADTINALTLTNGGKAVIGYKPFDSALAMTEAFSLVIKFKSNVVTNEDSAIIDIMNANGRGLKITSQEVTVITSDNNSLTRQFAYGTEYEIAIVNNVTANNNSSTYVKRHSGMLYLYINGELCGALQKGASESLFHTNAANITIDGTYAKTSAYTIRAYRRSLTPDEVFNLYLIDIGDNTKMLELYEKNNITDDSGIVTIDKVKAQATVPYMIITGNTSGMSTLLYAAAVNNKKSKYDLQIDANTPGEILFVNPLIPASNFHLIGGCIRLQGTSSLAYPIKNYRIYMKDSNKVAGTLYLGCDEYGDGGEIQKKPKYALRGYNGETPSIPVDCFCLKADYAESSSSHNTGFAVLINNVLKRAGEETPAQKYKDESYPYDVRTTVDGFPIYLFYRKTLADTPTFLGKFNFNNDKSTEAVFGFLNIPGYHIDNEGNPSDWITSVFNGENPTECWEFKNNSNPMGGFHFDQASEYNGVKNYDFTSFTTSQDEQGNIVRNYDWLDCWEARFPDDDDRNAEYESGERRPTYLEALATWISSTDTSVAGLSAAEIAARKTKFTNELKNYFDIDYLCDYYVSTVIVAAVDQQIKNSMLGFWYNPDAENVPVMGKVRGYFIFYDNDTILGVRNDGQLKYKWDVDENTIDPETNSFAYAGARSTLWVNLRTQFASKIQEAYLRLRGANKFSFDSMYEAFTINQTDKFPERMYNIDAVNKYISPLTEGVEMIDGSIQKYSYLTSLQGSRKYHRNWWVQNRLDMLDATYLAGDYKSTQLSFKGTNISSYVKKISVVSMRDWYYAIEADIIGNAAKTDLVRANETWEYSYNGTFQQGSIWHLYGVKFAKKIDVSLFSPIYHDFTLMLLPYLEELVLGTVNATITEYTTGNIEIGENLPLLKKINVSNHILMTRLDLSKCSQIEEFDCTGCTELANVVLPTTNTLKTAIYGSGIQVITLINKKNVESITAESFDNITTITLNNSNSTCIDFVFDILNDKLS